MPSHLRVQSHLREPIVAQATYQHSPTLPPAKKQKMSLTMTYQVASSARSKLGKEASRSDHNLRLLVGHANLLDSLMVELADAEREQEAWYNNSVRNATKQDEPRHIQWIDTIPEEDDTTDEESDDESDDDDFLDEDAQAIPMPRHIRASPVTISEQVLEEDEDEEMDADYEDDEEHSLTRVASQHSPPELSYESDESDSSDDESMPPSPENTVLEFSEKEREVITSSAFYDIKASQGLEDYVLQQPQGPIIAAC